MTKNADNLPQIKQRLSWLTENPKIMQFLSFKEL